MTLAGSICAWTCVAGLVCVCIAGFVDLLLHRGPKC
jgi:hypothetical protein